MILQLPYYKICEETKMKAKVKLMLPGFTGNMDDVVIYYNAHLNKFIARKKVIPSFTPDHQIMKDINAFARRITLSEAYKDDCREYIKLYNRKNRRNGRAMSTWPNVFLMVMRAMLKEHPEIDMKTLCRDDVLNMDLPCKCVADSINAGYLERVPGGVGLLNHF
ncbi:hypothetical protein MASR1M36_21560 [Candidatus Cloacimonadaceae bacterium]